MEPMWIGEVKANDVSGNLGLGQVFVSGMRTVSKSNVGNGTVTGDYACLPALLSMVLDPDLWDAVLITETSQTGR
jgi:hypothetical protein